MPDAGPVVVFDGDCGFCSTTARWLQRRTTTPIEPWQHLDLAALGLTEGDVRDSAWWVDGDLREHSSRAIGRALVSCGGVWALLGRIVLLPGMTLVGDPVYRLVARYRHRLPGGTPACRL